MIFCCHNSRNSFFRQPFGALETGSRLSLKLVLSDRWMEQFVVPENYSTTIESCKSCNSIKNTYASLFNIYDKHDEFLALNYEYSDLSYVYLHYSYGLYSFKQAKNCMYLSPYSKSTYQIWELDLTVPKEACLFFYWFELIFTIKGQVKKVILTRQTSYASNLRQVEQLSYNFETKTADLPYQVTVFNNKWGDIKNWDFAGLSAYQIFPDRFYRSKNFDFQVMTQLKKGEDFIFHKNWNEEVDFKGSKGNNYLALDFYGGQIRGILENIEYIASLNIDLIYFNPIFQARSNHRYDTADYYKPDDIFGSQEDLEELIEIMKQKNMSVILDGVFSHTGADSPYFNLYGTFSNIGAVQAFRDKLPSRYESWYNFYEGSENSPRYDSWWGFNELPTINKANLDFNDFISGEAGLLSYWQNKGINSWRLDVSDELPDEFIRNISNRLQSFPEKSYLLGEVWENASNKVSYGSYRDFALGNTHDAVMNYPLREAIIDLFKYNISVKEFSDRLLYSLETYPMAMNYMNYNLLSSHDVPRILSAISDLPMPDSREDQSAAYLSEYQFQIAYKRVLQAYLFLAFFPGIFSLYYGDEQFMEGFKDPFNRRPFKINQKKTFELLLFKKIIALRKKYRFLKKASIDFIHISNEILILRRSSENKDQEVYLIINRADKELDLKILISGFGNSRIGQLACFIDKNSADLLPPKSSTFISSEEILLVF